MGTGFGVVGRLGSGGRPATLSRNAAFLLFASIIPFFLGGSSAPTPLYALYREEWGFSPITITVVFGLYAIVVLATLLAAGSLSDHVGRRPVLIASALLQIVAMAIFATASGLGSLILARVLQGIGVGAATGAVGAALLDVDRERGTIANAVAPTIGTALGAIVSGVMVAYLPAPTVLVYAVFGAAFALQVIGLVAAPETATVRPGALASLRPHLAVPPAVRAALVWALPAMVAAWAIPGFYGSLGPLLVRQLLGKASPLHGGLALFVLAGSGAVGVLQSRSRAPQAAMRLGSLALVVGSALTWGAIVLASAGVFFVGSAIAGLGFGASFQGAVRSMLSVAEPQDRAGVVSMIYVVAYLALGVPAVLAGVGVVYGGGLLRTSETYMLVVTALATIAFVGTLVPRRAAAGA
jgi:MFS family permease